MDFTPLAETALRNRTVMVFIAAGVHTLEEVIALGYLRLKQLPGVGPTSVAEVSAMLYHHYGINLTLYPPEG